MIKNHFAKLLVLAPLVFSAACGDGGDASSQPTANVRTTNVAGFPHEVDFYYVPGAVRAVVFLHGGGGRNYKLAYDLGLNSVDAPPTSATANAAWLSSHKVLAVFPQGQSLPGGPATWDNHAMVSGQDDVAFLQDLAAYIESEYGISNIYLAGHSNGGMMANRMWCESPGTFKAYISLAGPASSYYLSTDCAPTSARPYFGIVGEQDDVLQVTGNWTAQTWKINPLLDADFLNPMLIGEWYQHQARSQFTCSEETTATPTGSTDTMEMWSNCGGLIRLQHLFFAGHMIDSLEAQTLDDLVDTIAGFIDDVERL